MLAKLSSKNQITLPKEVVSSLPETSYFEVEAINGQIVLTPARIQRADAVRAKLASLGITEQDATDAVERARR
jgi:hypothetical protein